MLKNIFGVMAVFVAASLANPAWACLEEGCGCAADPAKAEVQAALEKGDYEGFKRLAAKTDCKAKDKITAENFPRLQEAYRLMKAGKKDEAKAIKAELGLVHHEKAAGGSCPHHAKGEGHGKKHKKGHKCSGGCGHH